MIPLSRPARRSLPGALALVSLLAAAFAVVPSAHAETVSERDQVRDVVRIDLDNERFQEKRVRQHANADIKRWRVAYDQDEIRVLLTFRKLARKDPMFLGGTFVYRAGGEKQFADAAVEARKNRWKGRSFLETYESSNSGEGPRSRMRRSALTGWTAGEPSVMPCAVTHAIDYADDRVTITVPADCISSPRWVRFSGEAVAIDNPRKPSYLFYDASIDRRRGLSERIQRG